MNISPFPYFFCVKLVSCFKAMLCGIPWQWIRCSLNTEGCFGWNIGWREGKPIYRLHVYSSKNKNLPFPWWKQNNIISQLPRQLAKHSVEWLPMRDSVLLSNADRFRFGLDKWNSMFLNPCITSTLGTMPSFFFMSFLENDRDCWENRLTRTLKTFHTIHLIIKILCCEVTFWWVLHGAQYIFPSERPIHIPLPQVLLSTIFQLCSSMSLTIDT